MHIWKALLPSTILLVLVAAQVAVGQATNPSVKNGDPIAARLLDAADKPLAGMGICLLPIRTPHLPFDLAKNPDGCIFATTDASGHFSFAPQPSDYNILLFTDSGYAIKAHDLALPPTVHLTPWATLQGVLKIGDKTAPAGISVKASYVTDDMDAQQYDEIDANSTNIPISRRRPTSTADLISAGSWREIIGSRASLATAPQD